MTAEIRVLWRPWHSVGTTDFSLAVGLKMGGADSKTRRLLVRKTFFTG